MHERVKRLCESSARVEVAVIDRSGQIRKMSKMLNQQGKVLDWFLVLREETKEDSWL